MGSIIVSLEGMITDQMQLGGYTFAANPSSMVIPVKRRSAAPVNTLDGMQFFSWGMFIAGVRVVLNWNFMSPTQFSSLETLFEADAQIVWNTFTGTNYNAQIMNLAGEYFIYLDSANANYRQNVQMEMLIVSEV